MIDISLGGIAPDGMDMNGILHSATDHIRFINAGGQPVFSADLATEIGGYPLGVVLQDDAGFNSYINILANNTTYFNITPASIGVSWIFYNSIYSTVPVGACMYFPATAAPPGWLKRNGALVSRSTYAKLWVFAQASGNIVADGVWEAGMFSTGNGTTTFRIPDGRGEFDRGWDDSRGVDAGRGIGTYQASANLLHTHTVPWGGTNAAAALSPTPYYALSNSNSLSSSSGGSESRPRNISLLACIKY